jgi:hypothetical protein
MQVLDMTITFVEFSASVEDGTIADPSYIVARALELDRDFEMIFFKAPMSWRYETVYDANADPYAVFAGCYHEYESILDKAHVERISNRGAFSLHKYPRHSLGKKHHQVC